MNRLSASLAHFCLVAAVVCLSLWQPAPATSAMQVLINEFVFNHTGTDMYEFVELWGDPNNDLSDLTILEIDGDARAYPLRILSWHELVNDTVGAKPILVSW